MGIISAFEYFGNSPQSATGSSETPTPYPPNDLPCFACTSFLWFFFLKVKDTLKIIIFVISEAEVRMTGPRSPPHLNECIPGPHDNQVVLGTENSRLHCVLMFKVSGHELMKPLWVGQEYSHGPSKAWNGRDRGYAFHFWRNLSNSIESTKFSEHLLCARGRNTMACMIDTALILTEPTIGRSGGGVDSDQ